MPTIRQHIADLLATRAMSARDLSRSLGIREKEVVPHLEHLVKKIGDVADLSEDASDELEFAAMKSVV